MTEITSRLSTALADRYKIERHLGEGGMATVYRRERMGLRIPATTKNRAYICVRNPMTVDRH